MLQFFLHRDNIPFAIAIGILAGILALEVIGAILGFSLSGDNEADASIDLDGADSPTLVAQGLYWLSLGRIPLIAWLAVFSASFGISGYVFQAATAMALAPILALSTATFGGVIGARFVGGWLAKTVFKDETTAISAESLVGNVAQVTLGIGRRGAPTQGKVRDVHGLTHYVLIEPENEFDELAPGSEVILLRRDGPKYFAVTNSLETVMALDGGEVPLKTTN